jgi:hypothetical protein
MSINLRTKLFLDVGLEPGCRSAGEYELGWAPGCGVHQKVGPYACERVNKSMIGEVGEKVCAYAGERGGVSVCARVYVEALEGTQV